VPEDASASRNVWSGCATARATRRDDRDHGARSDVDARSSPCGGSFLGRFEAMGISVADQASRRTDGTWVTVPVANLSQRATTLTDVVVGVRFHR